MDAHRPPTVGIVLSAGASRRWQGAPKALLPVGDAPALTVILRRLDEAKVTPLRIVVGPEGAAIRAGIVVPAGVEIEWKTNPDRSTGPIGSIRVGLQALPPGVRVVLWPVDHPFVGPTTLPKLLDAADREPGAAWLQPEYAGRGGHPVVLTPRAWHNVATLDGGASLRTLRDALGPLVRRVAVRDAGVTVNLNTPEVYAEAVERQRARERSTREA